MYWTTHSTSISNLESIYGKGSDGLDELLDSDKVILKTRNGDEKLLNYLKHDEVLEKLVEYTIGTGLIGEAALRYPLIACELLCCEQPLLLTGFQDSPFVLKPLWKLPTKLTPPFMVCWSRLISHLLNKIPATVSTSLQEDQEGKFVGLLVQHLEKPEVCEVSLKLFQNETLVHWLRKEGMVGNIFDRIPSRSDSDFLLVTQNFISALMVHPLSDSSNLVGEIIEMIIDNVGPLLERTIVAENVDPNSFSFACELLSILIKKVLAVNDPSTRQQLTVLVGARLDMIHSVFIQKKQSIYDSPGGPVERVGVVRLKSAKLCADLVSLESAELTEKIRTLGIAELLIDMLFTHTRNNLLHSAVTEFITNIFTGDYKLYRQMIVSIFKDCRLTTKIIRNQLLNDSIILQPRRNRLGNMGHVTLIVDQIVKILEGHHGHDLRAELEDIIEQEDWQEYLDLSYREAKVKDALVLGGAKAPPPPPAEENFMSFTGLFNSGTDEQLARYFCQQVIANLPNRFVLADQDGDGDGDDDDDYDDIGEEDNGDLFQNDIPSIKIPMEPNGFDALLEMEMRLSSLGELPGDSDDPSEPSDHENHHLEFERDEGRSDTSNIEWSTKEENK